jgi:hypothetical protein
MADNARAVSKRPIRGIRKRGLSESSLETPIIHIDEMLLVDESSMRGTFALDGALPHYFLPLVAAILALASMKDQARAQEGPVFTVAASEGYGVAECLVSRGQCGQVVADAWCEAHGYGRAMAFGLADDVTASIGKASLASPSNGAVIIRCAE